MPCVKVGWAYAIFRNFEVICTYWAGSSFTCVVNNVHLGKSGRGPMWGKARRYYVAGEFAQVLVPVYLYWHKKQNIDLRS